MVRAANRKGNIPPRKRPTVVPGLAMSITSSPTAWVKAEKRASAVTAAEPMAKPLATAAVVLPSASSASVDSRTSGARWAISAMPPALSAMGP